MEKKILVAFATKHGATEEIAERIGRVFRDAGLDVAVLPVRKSGDPSGYAATILGSAVYMGQWLKDAAAYLTNHEKALAGRPVWLFSTGPSGQGDPVELLKGWRFPENLQPVADRIHPRGVALFHGTLDEAKLGLGEKMILKMVKAPYGDFRDWAAVAAWAGAIAASLKADPVSRRESDDFAPR